MADPRESVEELVREAVEETGGTQGLVLGEYVIIAAANGWSEDGEDVSQVVVIPGDGGESRILGLVEHARTTLKAEILGLAADL